MKLLEDLTIGQRVVLTAIIVIVLLLLLAAFGYFTGQWDEADAEAATQCVDEKVQEEIRELTLRGIDEGLRMQVAHLYEIWIRDPHEQPKRATSGMQAAISAYIRARNNALHWEATRCPPGEPKQP